MKRLKRLWKPLTRAITLDRLLKLAQLASLVIGALVTLGLL